MCCLWAQWVRKSSKRPLLISTVIYIGTRTFFMICTRLSQAENRVEGLSHHSQLLETVYKISLFRFIQQHSWIPFVKGRLLVLKYDTWSIANTKVFITFLGLESTHLLSNLEKCSYPKFSIIIVNWFYIKMEFPFENHSQLTTENTMYK